MRAGPYERTRGTQTPGCLGGTTGRYAVDGEHPFYPAVPTHQTVGAPATTIRTSPFSDSPISMPGALDNGEIPLNISS